MAKSKVVYGEEVNETELGELVGGVLDLNTELGKQPESVQAAVKAGDIVARINLVKRRVKPDGAAKGEKGKLYHKQYLQLVPTNSKGMFALANGVETTWKKDEKSGEWDFDGPCMVKDFFYGNDLGEKSKQSQRLAVLVEGPDKAKLAAAKQLAKAFNITEEEALKKIEAMA